jgi:hypothetical protein
VGYSNKILLNKNKIFEIVRFFVVVVVVVSK